MTFHLDFHGQRTLTDGSDVEYLQSLILTDTVVHCVCRKQNCVQGNEVVLRAQLLDSLTGVINKFICFTGQISKTYRSHANHISIAHQPHTDPILTTYQIHTDCITNAIPTTYRSHTNRIPTAWPITYRPHTDPIPTTYQIPTALQTPYRPHTDHIPTTYRPDRLVHYSPHSPRRCGSRARSWPGLWRAPCGSAPQPSWTSLAYSKSYRCRTCNEKGARTSTNLTVVEPVVEQRQKILDLKDGEQTFLRSTIKERILITLCASAVNLRLVNIEKRGGGSSGMGDTKTGKSTSVPTTHLRAITECPSLSW